MSNKSNIVIGVLAVLALVVGLVSYNKTPAQIVGSNGQQGPQGVQGAPGHDGRDGVDGARGLQGPAGRDGRDGKDGGSGQVFGAVSTLSNVNGPSVNLNGAASEYYGYGLTTATSTPCTIKSPGYRTSLVMTGLRVSIPLVGAGTNAITWGFSTSTTPNASTTIWQTWSTPESASPVFLVTASSSLPTATLTNIGANTWLNWYLSGTTTTTGTTYLRGSCFAQFVNVP